MSNFQEHTMADFVEAMLPTFSSKLALLMNFRLSSDFYLKNKKGRVAAEYNATTYIQMLVHRPTNYTKIYAREKENPHDQFPEIWTRVVDHDSVWRTEGFYVLQNASRKHMLAAMEHGEIDSTNEFLSFDLFERPAYTTVEEAVALDKGQFTFPKNFKLTMGKTLGLKEIGQYLR